MARYDITREELHVMDGGAMRTLRRIRALSHNGMAGTHPGDMGGWIEDASNLSQEGCCWVADGAMAYGGAVLKGDAVLHGRSVARGGAVLAGNTAFYDSVVDGGTLVDCDASSCILHGCNLVGCSLHGCRLRDCTIGCVNLENDVMERACLLHGADAAALEPVRGCFCIPEASLEVVIGQTWCAAARGLLGGDLYGERIRRFDGTEVLRFRDAPPVALATVDRLLHGNPAPAVRAWRCSREGGAVRFAREYFDLRMDAIGTARACAGHGAAGAEYPCTASHATVRGLAGPFVGGAAFDHFPTMQDVLEMLRGMGARASVDGGLFVQDASSRVEGALERASALPGWDVFDEFDGVRIVCVGDDPAGDTLALAEVLKDAVNSGR